MKKVRQLSIYFLFSVVLLLLNCLIKIKADFTKSGILSFYSIEIVGICVLIFIVFYIIKKWKSISKENKVFLLLTLIFSVYCIIDYAFRAMTQGLELKSILVIESNIFVIGFMFLALFKLLSAEKAIRFLAFFSCVLGALSVVLAYFPEYNISNIILLNHATRTYLLGVLLPVTVYQYITSKDKFSSACFYIHLASLIFCGLVSGSRLNYLMIPLLLIVTLIIIVRKKLFSWVRTIIAVVIPVLIVLVSANFCAYIYAPLTRISVTNAVVKALNITYSTGTNPAGTNPAGTNPVGTNPAGTNSTGTKETAEVSLSDIINKLNSGNLSEQEKKQLKQQAAIQSAQNATSESTSIRLTAWMDSIKDIEKNPLLGIGLQQYNITSSDGQVTVPIQPHNFILEYTMSFGIIGFLLWVVMFFAPVLLQLKTIRFRVWSNTTGLCAIMSLIFALAGAFLEPYFLFPCVMVFIYMIIGCFFIINLQERAQGQSKAD